MARNALSNLTNNPSDPVRTTVQLTNSFVCWNRNKHRIISLSNGFLAIQYGTVVYAMSVYKAK